MTRLLQPEPRRERPRQPQTATRNLSGLARWVAAQPEGNRNAGLFWAANRAVEAGDNGALDAIARGAKSAGLEEREIDRTIRSAQRTRGDARPFARERQADMPAQMADKEAGR